MAAAYLARRQGRIGDDLVGLHRRLLAAMQLPGQRPFDLAELRGRVAARQEVPGRRAVRGAERARPPEAGVPADEDSLAAVLADLAASPWPAVSP